MFIIAHLLTLRNVKMYLDGELTLGVSSSLHVSTSMPVSGVLLEL